MRGARRGKVILEKPFGESLAAAGELNRRLEAFFDPENIYRIDHYLGKEMVRNIQTIRFTNPIFTNLWDARFIESVQISALEEEGVGTRGGYYDTSGALKDMVQNHLFQILSIVAMERPRSSPAPICTPSSSRFCALCVCPRRAGCATPCCSGSTPGYRAEKAVAPDSSTETYAALRLFIDNDRWRGAPFYIRTGKKLGRREMQVAVVFRRPSPDVAHDVLLIKIQPTEGVYLQFNIKRPGDTDEVAQAKMDFCQSCRSKTAQHPRGVRAAARRLHPRRAVVVLPVGPDRNELAVRRTPAGARPRRGPAGPALRARLDGPARGGRTARAVRARLVPLSGKPGLANRGGVLYNRQYNR